MQAVTQGFYKVPISRALCLTRDDAVKPAILLELDTEVRLSLLLSH